MAFLAGSELPDAALIKTLLVPTGKQGVPVKLKAKGNTCVRTCTSTCTIAYMDTCTGN